MGAYLEPPPAHSAGHVLRDRYRIIRKIGAGGMGRVYLAENTCRNCEWVAVKENIDQAQDAREHLLQEIEILLHCSHPGLPKFIDRFAEADGRLYLVMSYIPGRNLDMLRAAQPVDEAHAVAWLARLCEILTYLHHLTDAATGAARPIAHRDVKPGNVILRRLPADIVLVDFGIACPARRHNPGSSSGYSPPEQRDRNAPADLRCDIFSAGATLLYLLTGDEPPDNQLSDWTDQLARQLRAAPMSQSAREIVARAMQREPRDRYPSAEALRADLLKCQRVLA